MIVETMRGVLVLEKEKNGNNLSVANYISNGSIQILPQRRLKENTHHHRWVFSQNEKQMGWESILQGKDVSLFYIMTTTYHNIHYK